MAVDMFLKIDTVDGEATDAKHSKSIDVLAFSWGASNSATFSLGGGGGGGKVHMQDFSVTKYKDKSTPKLLLACAKGTHYKDALITVRKAGDKPLEYLKYKLFDVMVSSVSHGGSGGEDRLVENLVLAFGKIEITYTPQKQDGSGDGPIITSYDVTKNE